MYSCQILLVGLGPRVCGGVCFYVKHSLSFSICVTYSNSACEILIIKPHTPSLIVILVYSPSSSTLDEFNDIIIKIRQCMFHLHSPLPNIIMLGDFNFSGVDLSKP